MAQSRRHCPRSLLLACVCSVLAACSTTETQPPAVPQPQAPVGQEAPAQPEVEDSIAAATLRKDARKAVKQNHFERALALLERAHRLDPDEPGVYLELARVYRRLGDEEMARATAERGLLYCDEARTCDKLRDYAQGT